MRFNKLNFIDRDDKGNIIAVYCKVTGKKIRELIPDTRMRSFTKGNKRILVQPSIFQPLNDYIEVDITMEDDSHHITPLCKGAIRGLSKAELSELYNADIDDMVLEGLEPDYEVNLRARVPDTAVEI